LKDQPLPDFALYANATKVQDETWELANGTFITKYDFSDFVRDRDFYGIYGPEVGSWYIHPGTDYYNSNQLSQTLTVSLWIIAFYYYVLNISFLGSPGICHRRFRSAECRPRYFSFSSRRQFNTACWENLGSMAMVSGKPSCITLDLTGLIS
jgi:hypothetical protein